MKHTNTLHDRQQHIINIRNINYNTRIVTECTTYVINIYNKKKINIHTTITKCHTTI